MSSVLRSDMLEDKLVEYISKSYYDIAKFMLSGQESFECVLNYVKRANKVIVRYNEIHIHVPNKKALIVKYNCAMVMPILKALGGNVKDIEVFRLSRGDKNRFVCEMLIHEGLKRISLRHRLPDDLMDKLKTITSLDDIILSCSIKLTDFCLIRPLPQKLNIEMEFEEIIREQRLTFPSIHELKIPGTFKSASLTSNTINLFVKNIVKCFPNLATLDVNFECSNCKCPDLYAVLMSPLTRIFKPLLKIKGDIQFRAYDDNTKINDVYLGTNGFKGLKYDSEEYSVQKKYKIHKNLSFTLYVGFPDPFGEYCF